MGNTALSSTLNDDGAGSWLTPAGASAVLMPKELEALRRRTGLDVKWLE